MQAYFVQNEQYPRQSAGIEDERFSETRRKINKDIVAPRKPSQIPVARKDCQVVRTTFHRFIANSVTAAVFMLSTLVFIEIVTMVLRDPLVQLRCTKEQPYARSNQNLLQKIMVTRGGWNKLLVADLQTDYTGVQFVCNAGQQHGCRAKPLLDKRQSEQIHRVFKF